MTAAVNNLSASRGFQTRYRDLLAHYGVSGQRINARQAHGLVKSNRLEPARFPRTRGEAVGHRVNHCPRHLTAARPVEEYGEPVADLPCKTGELLSACFNVQLPGHG